VNYIEKMTQIQRDQGEDVALRQVYQDVQDLFSVLDFQGVGDLLIDALPTEEAFELSLGLARAAFIARKEPSLIPHWSNYRDKVVRLAEVMGRTGRLRGLIKRT